MNIVQTTAMDQSHPDTLHLLPNSKSVHASDPMSTNPGHFIIVACEVLTAGRRLYQTSIPKAFLGHWGFTTPHQLELKIRDLSLIPTHPPTHTHSHVFIRRDICLSDGGLCTVNLDFFPSRNLSYKDNSAVISLHTMI